MRLSSRWRPYVFVLQAALLGVGLAPVGARASGQELRLDAAPTEGPRLRAENASTDLATRLESESAELGSLAERSAGEGRSAAAAKARLRTIAAYLLRSGASRPWSESAPAVFGTRMSLLIGRADGLIDLAARGRGTRDRPLSQSDAARALRLLDALGSSSIDPLRRASIAKPELLAAETASALRTTLAPLGELTALLEPAQDLEPWPVLAAELTPPSDEVRPEPLPSEDGLDVRIGKLPPGAARTALEEATAALRASGSIKPDDAVRLAGAAGAIAWLVDNGSGASPLRLSGAAVEGAVARIERMVRQLPAGEGGAAAAAALDSLAPCVAASTAILELKCMIDLPESARNDLADAVAALFAGESTDIVAERARARVAERIRESCERANRLESPEAASVPRDLKDAIRQLDRDARAAIRALPSAIKLAAADPVGASDPAALGGFERLRTLEQDRKRIANLQAIVDSVSSLQPSAGRAFAGIARRMARMLLDPLKRSDAQLAFAALEAQHGMAFPLPYEESLRRRTPRALELADRTPELVLARADRVRTEWCEAIGRGDFGGAPSVRLDEVARLFRALADLDLAIEPIDRAASDRLCMWGGWATRRSLAAPATQDLTARANLAARSFLAVRSPETQTMFERDLLALERAIPLVRLTASIERRVGPALRGDPDSLGAQLAPVVSAPGGGAYLAEEWSRLLALHRAMVESEFARRTGNGADQRALDGFMAELAAEIETRAFGPRRVVARVPGFDGTAREEPGGGAKRTKSGVRPR